MGKFINPMGYELTQLPEKRETKEYICALRAIPLMWKDDKGVLWQTGERFETDMGSIPLVGQVIPALQKDRYLLAYLFHDWVYKRHGLFQVTSNLPYPFYRMTRAEADAMLRKMIDSLGGWWITRWTVWTGVRMGGWWSW